MRIRLIIAKVFSVLLGLGILMVGLILFKNAMYYKNNCTVEIYGKITGIYEKKGEKNERNNISNTYHYPIIEYKVGNKVVSGVADIQYDYLKHRIDSQIEILYNPDNIEEFVVKGDKTNFNVAGIVIFMGMVIIVFTFAFFDIKKYSEKNYYLH